MGQELATQRLDIRHGMPQKFNWHFGMVRQCITLKYYDSESPALDFTHARWGHGSAYLYPSPVRGSSRFGNSAAPGYDSRRKHLLWP